MLLVFTYLQSSFFHSSLPFFMMLGLSEDAILRKSVMKLSVPKCGPCLASIFHVRKKEKKPIDSRSSCTHSRLGQKKEAGDKKVLELMNASAHVQGWGMVVKIMSHWVRGFSRYFWISLENRPFFRPVCGAVHGARSAREVAFELSRYFCRPF